MHINAVWQSLCVHNEKFCALLKSTENAAPLFSCADLS